MNDIVHKPVVGDNRKKHGFMRYGTRPYVVGACILALLIIGVGTWRYTIYRQNQSEVIAMRRDEELYREAKKRLDMYRSRRQYDKALGEADEYIKSGKEPMNIAMMYVDKGATYEMKGELGKALEMYTIASKKTDKDFYGLEMGIARVLHRSGDKKGAIVHYKKCVDILKRNDAEGKTARAMEIDYLQKTITKLEKSEVTP